MEEECIKSSICDSTICWKSGLRAYIKSMHTGKFKCEQCQWTFKSLEMLKEHIAQLYTENLDHSQVLQKIKCFEWDWSFMNEDNLIPNIARIAKSCTENISSVVKVSSYFYQNMSVLLLSLLLLSLLLLSQFDFFFSFVTI